MKRFFVWLYLALPLLSFGQENYLKGFVITNANETLHGLINYRGYFLTPTSIQFKTAADAPLQTFSLENCAGFGIDEKETFERFTVDLSTAYTRTSKLEIGLDTNMKRQTVFLKVIQKGKNLNLYSYTDEIKERFLVKGKSDTEPYELLRARYLDKYNSTILADFKYRHQLTKELTKYEDAGSYDPLDLNVLKYETADILTVVSAINDQKVPKLKNSATRLFAGIGASVSLPKYSKNNVLETGDQLFQGSYMPMINAGVDFLLDPGRGKYILKLELALFNSKNKIVKGDFSHYFDQTSAALMPQFIFNFYQKKKFEVFAGAGAGANLSMYRNNRSGRIMHASFGVPESFEASKVEFMAFNLTTVGKLGIVLDRKLVISAGYIPPSVITDYSGFSISMQRLTFGVNYFFGAN